MYQIAPTATGACLDRYRYRSCSGITVDRVCEYPLQRVRPCDSRTPHVYPGTAPKQLVCILNGSVHRLDARTGQSLGILNTYQRVPGLEAFEDVVTAEAGCHLYDVAVLRNNRQYGFKEVILFSHADPALVRHVGMAGTVHTLGAFDWEGTSVCVGMNAYEVAELSTHKFYQGTQHHDLFVAGHDFHDYSTCILATKTGWLVTTTEGTWYMRRDKTLRVPVWRPQERTLALARSTMTCVASCKVLVVLDDGTCHVRDLPDICLMDDMSKGRTHWLAAVARAA